MGAVNRMLMTCDGCDKSAYREDGPVGWCRIDRLSATSLDSLHSFSSEHDLYFCGDCSDALTLPWSVRNAPGRMLKKLAALIGRRPV
jgi:hypothetical protein